MTGSSVKNCTRYVNLPINSLVCTGAHRMPCESYDIQTAVERQVKRSKRTTAEVLTTKLVRIQGQGLQDRQLAQFRRDRT